MKVYVVTSMFVDIAGDTYDQCVEGVFDSEEKAVACKLTALREAQYDISGEYLEADDEVDFQVDGDSSWIADQDRMFEVIITEKEIE